MSTYIIVGLGLVLIFDFIFIVFLNRKYYADKLHLQILHEKAIKKLEKENADQLQYYLSRLDEKDKLILKRCSEIEKLVESKIQLEANIKTMAVKLRKEIKKKEMYKQRVYRRDRKIEKIKNKNITNK